MIISSIIIGLLLSNTVQGNDCTKTFTISPGNITRYTPPVSALFPTGEFSTPVYCDYFIRAPSSSYFIEVNFTKLRLQQNDGQSSYKQPSSSQPDSKSMSSSSSSQQQQTSQTSQPPGGRQDNTNNKIDTRTSCLPNIAVVEVMVSGEEQVRQQFCLKKNNVDIPTVFRSTSHIIKLHYSWDPRQSVSFALTFVFHKWPSPCGVGEFTCDSTCLPDSLVCNTVIDCVDQSDELNCVVHSSPVNKQFTEVIVIVVVVVFTLGVIACVFVHYRLTTRMWREHHQDSSSAEHHHLTPHTPQSTEVVYVPSAMEHMEQEVALQRERQIRLHGIQMGMELNLPPNIRISEDGEEGYRRSQRLLKYSCDENGRRESIRPPPNKIVYQGDSPPPYRSNSISKIEGHYYGGGKRTPATSSHLTTASVLANKISGNNSPSIMRCHSISGEGRPVRATCVANHHACHTGLPSGGHVTGASSRCYHGYHSSQLACSHPSHSSHSYSCSPPGGALHAPGGAATPQTMSSAPSAKALKTRISSHPVSHVARTDSPLNSTSSHYTTNTGYHSSVQGTGRTERAYFGPPPDYTEVASTGSAVSGPVTSQPIQSDSKV